MSASSKTIVVTGDISVDWRFARRANAHELGPASYSHHGTGPYREHVGAVLLGKIIHESLQRLSLGDDGALPRVLFADPLNLGNTERESPYWDYYFTCAEYPRRNSARGSDAIWRIAQELAVDSKPASAVNLLKDDDGDATIVVVQNVNQGFARSVSAWPRSFCNPQRDAWLLLRWSHPLVDRTVDFWRHAAKLFANRIVIVTTVDDLRFSGMQISHSLSWEQTVEDLCREVQLVWNCLEGCAHFVVSFPTSGALLFTATEDRSLSASLIFDPRHIEGSWFDDYSGAMNGFTVCLTAGIALEMIRDPGSSKLRNGGITAGVIAGRHLLEHGFVRGDALSQLDTTLPQSLSFPTETIAATLADAIVTPSRVFQTVPVPIGLGAHWRIMDTMVPGVGDIARMGYDVVTYGSDDFEWPFPTTRVGKLFITDRAEMENIRTIRDLLANYVRTPLTAAPFSMAVFGPPGVGKSFTVNELASELSGSVEALTFNLSQFTEPGEIAVALQQVRDIGVLGKIPLVFWDEFDTTYGTRLGWLRYFLAPMQDGEFKEGSMTRKIGRAVFAFAGGTNASMHEFLGEVSTIDIRASREAKVPDFISRLKGYIDIPTLDHGEVVDIAKVLRRAELLRVFVMSSAEHLVEDQQRRSIAGGYVMRRRVNVDPRLVYAFLMVKQFRYGARSMEAIVRMSSIGGKNVYDLSSLPPRAQLALHVDPDLFSTLTTRLSRDAWTAR